MNIFMQRKMRNLHLLFRRLKCSVNVTHKTQYRTVGTAPETTAETRQFHEIPKEGYPLIGNLLGSIRNAKRSFLYFKEIHEKNGPIFRSKVGPIEAVFILDPVGVEQVFRAEPKYPQRFQVDIWHLARKEIGEKDGLLTSEGSEWHSNRQKVNLTMLNRNVVNSAMNGITDVARDFLDYLMVLQKNNKPIELNEEIFKWSVETIGNVLYDIRLGCFGANPSVEGRDFANAVKTMMQTTEQLVAFPGKLAKVLFRKTWEKHRDATAFLFKTARKYIDQTMDKIKLEEDREEGKNTSLLQHLVTNSDWEGGGIYASVTEMMVGGVDTTANTIVFAVDILSRNPDIQQKLHAELFDVIRENVPTAADFQNTPYLRGVVKETLRLYPVANTVGRVLQEDTVVLGYRIPKGMQVVLPLYAMGQNEKVYSDPLHFKPERWFRDHSAKKSLHAFAFLPFGFGTRMCVGRRIAELEMLTFLAMMYKQFQTELTDGRPLELTTRLALVPNSPVQIRMVPRASRKN